MSETKTERPKNSPGFECDERSRPENHPRTLDALSAEFDRLKAAVQDPDVVLNNNADGYGKCVEAMWRFAYAAHEIMAGELGVTGFQHSMSALHLLGVLNGIQGPFMYVKAEDGLFPQYDIRGRVDEFLESESVRGWLSEQASEKLAESPEYAHPRVVEHWRQLVQREVVTSDD